MIKNRVYLFFALFILTLNVFSSGSPKVSFYSEIVAELPGLLPGEKNEGLAGAFSGITGDRLFIAGGANFPVKRPWEGGAKKYHDKIYTYKIEDGKPIFESSNAQLPGALAYGASVSLPEGVLCIGGSDGENCQPDVFLLSFNADGTPVFEAYPSLPVSLAYASAAKAGQYIYVAAGSSENSGEDTGNHFYVLDLSKKGAPDFGWDELPAFPGKGRLYPVVVAQSNGNRTCVYMFGGRNVGPSKEITIFDDAFEYDPVLKEWSPVVAAGNEKFLFMAGSGFPVGAHSIVFAGGAKGDLLLKEQNIKKHINTLLAGNDTTGLSQYKRELLEFYTGHPGFSKDIVLFNTITKAILPVGTFNGLCPVTTNVVPYNDGFFLTSGEIKPGIRTPEIFFVSAQSSSYSFGWLNSMVIFIYFLVLVVIGYIFSRKQKSTDDYFKGGGRVPWWAAGLSLFGTALSAITFMAIPAKTYSTDWSYFAFNMSIFLVAPLIIALFVPFYRRLNVTTAYEYLEKRFNLVVRLIGSISFILFQVGRMGIILLLPSLALNVVTGMDVYVCIVLMGLVSLVYTLMGGIEAVIWTDVIQVIVLLIGAVVAILLMASNIDGGFATVVSTASASQKFNLLDLELSLREPTVWVMLIGGLFTNITTYGTDQAMVQRYLTTKDEKEARRSVWTNAWLTIPSSFLFFSIGTVLFVFYRNFPELNNPLLSNGDSIFPWYIASEMPAGLSGLLIAGIFAAAMSSLSSSMNSGATAYTTDIHFRFSFSPEASGLKTARVATLTIGLMGTVFALFMASWNIHSLWDEFNKIIGLVIGSLGGLFLLGILSRKANGAGALVGVAVSIVAQIYVSSHHTVHLLLFTATGVISCFVAGWLASLFLSKYNKEINGLTIFKNK